MRILPLVFLSMPVYGMTQLPAPELGEVWTRDNDRQTEIILTKTKDMLIERAKKDTLTRRDAHPKAHGCVKAQFQVNPESLPANLRVGVFAQKAKYDSWIRFSNGTPGAADKSDLEKDVRGMALKLMNISGTPTGSQDFVMITAEEFFSKDGDDYLALHKGITGGKLAMAAYGISHPFSVSRLLKARVQLPSPLDSNYHSSVPYKLGSKSMRFHVKPCADSQNTIPDDSASPSYLKDRLAKTLNEKDGCFNFYVQPNMDPKRQEVEDPRLAWDHEKSPLIKVATVSIPRQQGIHSAAQTNFCENLNFNPWHSKLETRPLGQINRMRSIIYQEISKFRHDSNKTVEMEPVDHEPCKGKTQELCEEPRH